MKTGKQVMKEYKFKAYDSLIASLTKAESKYKDLTIKLGALNKRTIRAQKEAQNLRQKIELISKNRLN